MARDDKYFQFPISILKCNKRTRTPWIVSAELAHAIVDVALTITADEIESRLNDPDSVFDIADRYADRYGLVYDGDHEGEGRMLAACELLNVKIGGNCVATATGRIRKSAKSFLPFSGTQCRLRTDILWSMINDEWPINKVRTLIAIYAGIGQNQSQWLAYSRIRALCGGYSGIADAKVHLNTKRKMASELPSLKAVRHSAEKLWRSNFFQVVVVDSNKRIYSNKHQDDRALKEHISQTRKVKKRLEKL